MASATQNHHTYSSITTDHDIYRSSNSIMVALVTIVLLLAFIRPQEFLPAFQVIPVVPIALLSCLAAWVVGPKLLDGPITTLVFLFFLSTTFSHIFNGYFAGATDWMGRFIIVCMTFFFVVAACRSINSLRFMMFVFAGCGIALAIHGIDQYYNGVSWSGETAHNSGRIRYIGILNDPNDLGLFLVMGLPFIFMFMRQSRSFVIRVFGLAAVAAILYACYLTQSRGTLLSVAVMLSLWVYRKFGKVLAGAFGVAMVASASLLPGRMGMMSASEESAFGRVEAWYVGLNMFEAYPLFGVGPGMFLDHHYRTAHSTFVLVLAETGFIGFGIFLALFTFSAAMLKEVRLQIDLPARCRDAATALQYSMLAFGTAALFLSRSYVLFFYVVCAMVSALYSVSKSFKEDLKIFRISDHVVKLTGITFGGIFACYLLVRILHLTA